MNVPKAISHIAVVSSNSIEQRLYGWQTALCIALESDVSETKITHLCAPQPVNEPDQVVTLSNEIVHLLKRAGVTESQLIQQCDGGYHFADRYRGWSSEQQDFYLCDGELGVSFNGIEFQHYLTQNFATSSVSLSDFSLTASCAKHQKFALPVNDQRSILSTIRYTVNVSAIKYIELLRDIAKNRGVVESTSRVDDFVLICANSQDYMPNKSGFIDKLVLTDGSSVDADFYIDCSTSFNRAIGHQIDFGRRTLASVLATTAQISGFAEGQGQATLTTLKHALPNGHFMLSRHAGGQFLQVQFNRNNTAVSQILSELKSHVDLTTFDLSETQPIDIGLSYVPWSKNCLLLGPAACELGQSAGDQLRTIVEDISRFFSLYPDSECDPVSTHYYNEKANNGYQSMLDWHWFAAKSVTHFDTPFWRHHGKAAIPNTLSRITELFHHTGCFPAVEQHAFTKAKWIYYMLGFEVFPLHVDPLLSNADPQQIASFLNKLSSKIKVSASALPDYQTLNANTEIL